MKKIFFIVCIFILFASCYDDLGNYDYHDINRIEKVTGIDSIIRIRQFDTLRLSPELAATQYNDPERFNYDWEIEQKIVSTEQHLVFPVVLSYGDKNCRLIVTDKEQGNEYIYPFRLIVTEERAGDVIMVLSNYQGKAELSFKPLIPDTSRFAVNYYERSMGRSLGTMPQRIFRNYKPIEAYSGLLVRTAEGLRSLADTTLEDVVDNIYLDEEYLQRQIVYPKPSAPGFSPESVWSGIINWDFFFGSFTGSVTQNLMVSQGKLYSFSVRNSGKINVSDSYVLGKESPYGGRLSPVYFPVVVTPAGGDFFIQTLAYTYSDYGIMFDETVGRFLCVSGLGNSMIEIPVTDMPAFEGYRMIYGTHTNVPNYCVAILAKGDKVKALYLQVPRNSSEKNGTGGAVQVPFRIAAQMDMPETVMNGSSDFYQFRAKEFILVSAGNQLLSGNVAAWESGIAPEPVFSLEDIGYGADAEIACFEMSRTEKSIILGISRYGTDRNGDGEELKGDVVILDATTYQVRTDQSGREMIYRGVSGYPVDIMVKWQTWYRDGKNQNGTLMDVL